MIDGINTGDRIEAVIGKRQPLLRVNNAKFRTIFEMPL
jgi:hypothetical protein